MIDLNGPSNSSTEGTPVASQRKHDNAVKEVLHIALPLMVSTGTFSLVLFADRTLLLWYDGISMSAAMAAGNLFWVCLCLPVGIVSMTGAVISQHIGAGQDKQVGRLLWQSVWITFLTLPLFLVLGLSAETLFQITGQPSDLIPHQARYFQILMFGAAGMLLEVALSGFFSGTERSRVIMWVSVATGLVNLIADFVLIFGAGPVPELGIAGAAIASVLAIWFKAFCYIGLVLRPKFENRYQILAGFTWDTVVFKRLLFFGFPAGLMHLVESGGFTAMMLRIGTLGDVSLRATTMAINFNMVAFIPLVGLSIAASVLVGRHLLESGPREASKRVAASIGLGMVYSGAWLIAYLLLPDTLLNLYRSEANGAESLEAMIIARTLFKFIACYVVFDAIQLILAGALRGAGDTWFVLLAGFTVSVLAVAVGYGFEPAEQQLLWWWSVLTGWIIMLAIAMSLRFMQGRWKSMRMIETTN